MNLKKYFKNKVTYDPRYGTGVFTKCDKSGDRLIANIRGWGFIQYEFKTEKEAGEFQDSVGQFIVDAINEKIDRDLKVGEE
tara:strand:- start:434 stop:676 length:243 start_codon:yes stop_codon:yes gene_type:complete